jgi:hypothetical protein
MKLRRVITTETMPDGRKAKRRSVKWYAVFCENSKGSGVFDIKESRAPDRF